MAFLEDYTMLEELGRGGFATVYKVRHNKLGYIRAIRVLNAIIAHGEKDKIYQKFLDECKLLLRLGNGNHPNIIHIYQPLLKAEKAIVEMDYVDGKDLFQYLKDNNHFVSSNEVIRLIQEIGSALAYCHEDIYKFCMDRDEDNLKDDPKDGSKILLDEATKQRLINKYEVIHNDIHSGNIIRRENGSYVLLDFGLAIEGNVCERSSKKENGAPEFKSPEKWENNGVLTSQSDIYSFGVVLYEYLTGYVPFQLEKGIPPEIASVNLIKQVKEQAPAPIFERRKDLYEKTHPGETYQKDYPNWLETAIMKCLDKDPNNRFKNGKELYDFVIMNLKTDLELLQDENKKLKNKIIEFGKKQEEQNPTTSNAQVNDSSTTIDLENEYTQTKEKLDKALNEQIKQQTKINELKVQIEDIKKKYTNDKNGLTEKLQDLTNENSKLKKELSTSSNSSNSKIWQILTFVLAIAIGAVGYLYFNAKTVTKGTSENTELVESLENRIKVLQDALNKTKSTNSNSATPTASFDTEVYQKQIDDKDKEIQALKKELALVEQQASQPKTQGRSSSSSSEQDKTIQNLRYELEQQNKKIKELEKYNSVLKEELLK